jgi:predicted ATP-grasp superfamily ATP-dependent carboligase
MLQALVDDFQAIPSIQTSCLLHESFPSSIRRGSCRRLRGGEEESFRALARQADFTVVIAPELGGLLLERARWVEGESGALLSPLPQAIELTADKLALHHHWENLGIPTPFTAAFRLGISIPNSFPIVVKPRSGAGSYGIRSANDGAAWADLISEVEVEPFGDLILQPYVAGIPASIAFLVGSHSAVPLRPARQLLSDDGRFRFIGGELPLPEPLAQRALALGFKAVAGIPGLRGYVGVDMVLGNDDGGAGDFAIEINPRLTTSYVGLRILAESNLTQAMLGVVQGKELSAPTWKRGSLRFTADGDIYHG